MDDTADTVLASLPPNLVDPHVYLSARQAAACTNAHPSLRWAAPQLPGWVPQRCVAEALGYGQRGIKHALQTLNGGRAYVWATEFENVHSTWTFDEPGINVGGVTHECSEAYYQSRKPV
eukprot:3820693-Prymnesium_polylepis.1